MSIERGQVWRHKRKPKAVKVMAVGGNKKREFLLIGDPVYICLKHEDGRQTRIKKEEFLKAYTLEESKIDS